ncbi:alpha/beta fold hydrolase [Pseudobacillus wudalianchiensis]|uniref:3-oxoadipate enol-lactonase n=1 Tax=Pseudobacillus wudalianchiensis TaxID=1743143 RepID=A0A1B9B9Y4_9BACI|nr:alpha/beta fold hydrolase [Bacillus wudalianchiensis]OCA92910.1 3-oxoadipate enol-lactonase [Bacillus wudalianchiensis]
MPIAVCDQGVIRYEEKGMGEPLILIHGVGLDHTMWEKQVEGLSKHFRVIVYDMVGHGGSEHPPAPYTLSQFVEQLAELMNYLKIGKSHVIGFSMGGMVAQAFALKYQEKMKTLTIMSAVANRTAEQRKAILLRVEEVRKTGAASTIEPAIQRWFNKEFIKKEKAIVDRIRKRLETNDPSSYLAAYTLFATADEALWPSLKQISQPTFILTGEHDIGSNPAMAKQMHHEIAHSEVLIVPGMKHMLPIEGADTVNKAIRFFIEKQAIPAK